MKYSIGRDVLNASSKCTRGFSCTYGDTDCLCEFKDAIDDKLLFVKPRNDIMCDYKLSFGYSQLCNCPTRKELYRIYRI